MKCSHPNRLGKPCARIPAPGQSRCYKHADGLETLTHEDLEAWLGWSTELDELKKIQRPTAADQDYCKALWVMTHCYEVLARQRAGLKLTCPTPCGLCMALDAALRDDEPPERRPAVQAIVAPVPRPPTLITPTVAEEPLGEDEFYLDDDSYSEEL